MHNECICDELSDWDIDEEDESWCSRNCGVTNCGKYPEMNCYKEWVKIKRRLAKNESRLGKSIEIVKHGCASDDVCEWKLTDTRKVMPYKTSCGNEDLYDNSYKYCPYCGKRIKVIGD